MPRSRVLHSLTSTTKQLIIRFHDNAIPQHPPDLPALSSLNSMASVAAPFTSTILPAREIPLTFASSVAFWWGAGDKEASAAQERLLRRLPFFSSDPVAQHDPNSNADVGSPSNAVVGRVSNVQLGAKRFLNMFSITPTGTTTPGHKPPPPTVILHGYGAGLGFFFLNYGALGTWAGRRGASIYALDWLGMGQSARVPFKITAKREDIEGRVTQAEDFFLDALEEWREKQGIEKMNLVGHSLGGYLSAAYALRHPTRVSRLILLSPAGIPEDPSAPARLANAAAEAAGKVADKVQPTLFRRFITHAWDAGWSPFQIVRSSLFWGPMLVGKYSSRRFAHLTDDDVRDVNDYVWHITRAKGSGEYCISHILAPGAFARLPMVDRIKDLKIPVTFVYGDNDWMDVSGGKESVRRLRTAGNRQSKTVVIPYAGHHLYLDNPDEVNDLLVAELEATVPQ